MSRKNRIWYKGAVYHVMSRGVHKEPIFDDSEDRATFIRIMRHYANKYEFDVYAYSLMTNHFHLLIKTYSTAIWEFMHALNRTYARYYNRKNGICGHFFEGRYKACLVEDDSYLLQVSRYIHLNPVKAGIVKHADEYRWSSFRSYCGYREDDSIKKDVILRYFPGDSAAEYKRFVESGEKFSDYDDIMIEELEDENMMQA